MKIRYLLIFGLIFLALGLHAKKREEVYKEYYVVLAFVSLSQQTGYAEMEARMNMQAYPRCPVEKAIDIIYHGAMNSPEAVFDCSRYEE